ncbi:hemolysin family protein [Coriobacteriia bacterium Es71-Z0120]|uniref:hemolysin family protein n=1 Tax=Parvivirga hydrogeniphila TaxID=2939460 RepID=UPI002260B87C|nr:hemolysin family protein [Parvivirga hydrogeniphila]MCL4078996.1 hemolysin family protein [Parvivirga hydrogeniphila]
MGAAGFVAAFLFVVFVVCAMALSAAEASIALLSRGRAHRLAESGRRGGEELQALSDRPGRVTAAATLVRAVAYALAGGLTWAVVAPRTGGAASAAILAAVVGAVYSLSETLPRSVAVHNPERVGLAVAPAARVLVSLAYPVARALAAVWMRVMGLVAEQPVEDPWVSEEDYRASAEDEESAKEEAEEAIMDAVADFTTKIVREVMVPRTDMVCVADDASVSEALETIERSGYSRLPVYHGSVDDIRGVLYAKDLLVCLGKSSCPATVAPIARPPYFVPETKPVEELLVEMRSKTHIAIVADEYGGTAGLVTIEDLLEEIVGEIFDEYDVAEPTVVDLGDGRVSVDARMPVDDLNEMFGTDIEPQADSVGGLFVELAGHIPSVGESIEVEGLRLSVDAVDRNRVRRILVEPAAREEEPDE